MKNEKLPSSAIEIITYPKDRMELSKFANSMTAVNRDYRRWLAEKGQDPDAHDLKLYIEKAEKGSIKIWLANKFREMGGPIIGFGLDFFSKIKKPDYPEGWPSSELKNKYDYLNHNRGNRIHIAFLNLTVNINSQYTTTKQFDITSDEIEDSRNLTKELMGKPRGFYPNTPVRFTRFDIGGNAKIIARKIAGGEYIAQLGYRVRDELLREEPDNIFKKEYLADIVVHKLANGKIEKYVVKGIVANQHINLSKKPPNP